MSDYMIVQAESASELEDKVRDWKKMGWRCQGGVAVAVTDYPDPKESENNPPMDMRVETWAQAMVRSPEGPRISLEQLNQLYEELQQ